MARVQLRTVLQPVDDVAGNAITGASVQINLRGAGAATVYAASAGGTTVANPLTTVKGRVPAAAWVDEGSYDAVTTYNGVTDTDQFEAFSGTATGNFALKARLPVNVKDYGAAGDGTTDDTAAFTSARDAAGIGGTVTIPPGTYRLDGFAPLERQLYQGQGVGVTILKAKVGAARVVTIEGKFLAKLENLTVDGNAKAADGIRIRGTNSAAGSSSQRNMLERVRVTQCATGVRVDGAGAADQADKNLYVEVMIDNCTIGFESATSNSQQQCFIGGSIDDCTSRAIKTNGTMTFIGWQAQQTLGGAGVTMIEFTGAAVDSIVLIDCITETHDITFDSGAGNNWPLNGVQVYASVLQANSHIAKVDRAGTPVALIIRGSRLNGGIIDLRGNSTTFVDEYNAPSSTTTVTRTGAGTRHIKRSIAGSEGQSVASAGSITIPAGAETVFITGTTAINTITTATAYHGQEVTLVFAAALTVQNTGNLKMAGGVNFSATADDTITFVYSGADGLWREKARSVN